MGTNAYTYDQLYNYYFTPPEDGYYTFTSEFYFSGHTGIEIGHRSCWTEGNYTTCESKPIFDRTDLWVSESHDETIWYKTVAHGNYYQYYSYYGPDDIWYRDENGEQKKWEGSYQIPNYFSDDLYSYTHDYLQTNYHYNKTVDYLLKGERYHVSVFGNTGEEYEGTETVLTISYGRN